MWPLKASAFLMTSLFLSVLRFLSFHLAYVNNQLQLWGTLRTFSSVGHWHYWHQQAFYMYRCSEFSHVHRRVKRFTVTFLNLEMVFQSGIIDPKVHQTTRWSKSHLFLKLVIPPWQAMRFLPLDHQNSRGSPAFLCL